VPGAGARRRERAYNESLGWKWTPTMRIGQGCKVHLRADELPVGRLIVSVSRHAQQSLPTLPAEEEPPFDDEIP